MGGGFVGLVETNNFRTWLMKKYNNFTNQLTLIDNLPQIDRVSLDSESFNSRR